jgi:hypothetical protein
MNPCFSLRIPSFFRRSLGVLGACLLAASAVRAAELVTSFEESEGFREGNALTGQEGWEGTDTWKVRSHLAVTTEEAYQGTQSVLANNAMGTYSYVQSPDLGKNGFTGLSFFLKNSDVEFSEENQPMARWEIIYGNPDGTSNYRIVVYLRFTTGKTFHLHLSSTNDALNGAVGSRNILNKSNFRLGEWNEFGMEFDFTAKTLVLTVNGAPVSSIVKLHPENATANCRITGFRMATPTAAASGISFYDVVNGSKGSAAAAKP